MALQIKKIVEGDRTSTEKIAEIEKAIEKTGKDNKEFAEELKERISLSQKQGWNDDRLADTILLSIDEFIYNKLDDLTTSSMFWEDERQLKDAIAEYSHKDAHGDAFNSYLRKATF